MRAAVKESMPWVRGVGGGGRGGGCSGGRCRGRRCRRRLVVKYTTCSLVVPLKPERIATVREHDQRAHRWTADMTGVQRFLRDRHGGKSMWVSRANSSSEAKIHMPTQTHAVIVLSGHSGRQAGKSPAQSIGSRPGGEQEGEWHHALPATRHKVGLQLPIKINRAIKRNGHSPH